MLAVRALAALAAAAVVSPAIAGPLTPPAGSPSPTYKTLQQVEPRGDINALPAGGSADHVIVSEGSYYLTGNITTSNAIAIRVLADNVTIDLNGFTIDGQDRAQRAILASINGGTVTVRNGTIRNFNGFAIDLDTPNTTGVNLADVEIKDCGTGVDLGFNGVVLRCKISNTTTNTPAILAASDATIRDTTLAGINGDGMLLGDRAVVERVRVRNVGGVGIRAGSDAMIDGVQMSITSGNGIETADHSIVRHARVLSAGNNGVQVGGASIVQGVAVEAATGDGIVTGTGSRIEGCIAENCGIDGIDAGTENAVINCLARNNGDDGIETSTATVIENCTASFNIDNGIFVGTGSIVRGCTAANNDGIGILAGFSSNIQSCTVYLNGSHGIQVNGDSTVRFCNADNNGRLTSSGAGIRNIGSGTVIDSCNASDNDEGIFAVNDTLVMRCFADGNGTDYLIAPGMPVTSIGSLSTAGPFDNIEGF